MDDEQIHQQIEGLVAEEHRLWQDESSGSVSEADRQRLASLKVSLDQCWDLLRQRRAAGMQRDLSEFPPIFLRVWRSQVAHDHAGHPGPAPPGDRRRAQ